VAKSRSSSTRFQTDRIYDDPTCPRYPLDSMDRVRLNQIIRHRVRNICGGTRMILDVLKTRLEGTAGNPIPWNRLYEEVDDMQDFSRRLDLLVEPLPPEQPLALRQILEEANARFTRQFPLCSLAMNGTVADVLIPAGNLYGLIIDELLANAGRAAGPEGAVELAWTAEPRLHLAVANTGPPFSRDIPTAPPVPFHTTTASRDGMGLAIVYRICLRLALDFHVFVDTNEMSAVVLTPAETETNRHEEDLLDSSGRG
jgi:signal transduction histidine kinase